MVICITRRIRHTRCALEMGVQTCAIPIFLLPAASSSVGMAAMQIANRMGAKPIAITRGRSKVQKLQDAGAAEVIVSGEENVAERVMDITNGKGARLILDPIGGSAVDMFAQAIAQKATS